MKKIYILLLPSILLIFSCEIFTTNPETNESDDLENQGQLASAAKKTYPESMFDSSMQTDDPYTVENMRKALKELIKKKNKDTEKPKLNKTLKKIEPNYLYVRFFATGKEQKYILWKKGIELSEHPLDYKENNRWKDFMDETLPDSTQAFYGVVPIDYEFEGDIQHEIIKGLFLIQPILHKIDSLNSMGISLNSLGAKDKKEKELKAILENLQISFEELEVASRFLTNNLNDEFKNSHLNALATNKSNNSGQPLKKTAWWSRWRPSGTLKYRDTHLGDVPVIGVRVTAGYSYYWRSSTTNSNGYFSSPERWTYSVKYKAHWDADNFLMENGDSWYGDDLMSEGPTSYSAWNRTFTDEHAAYAAAFTAAYTYYYGDINGLSRPHQNGWFSFRVNMHVFHSDGGVYGSYLATPFIPDLIKIYLKDGTVYRSSDGLFATMVHELAHSAH